MVKKQLEEDDQRYQLPLMGVEHTTKEGSHGDKR